jgi:MFS family permease
MSELIRPLLLILLFVATAFLTIYVQQPPTAAPATAPASDFSSARALKHVQAIAQRPRPIGSAASGATREYVSGELRALGLDPQIQTAATLDPDKGPPYQAATVRNVVARLKGTGGNRAVLLVAHYDSVPMGPGASDDGVGVAALLETARALKSGPPPSNDVIFLFTEGEEVGLLGARAFVGGHPWAKDVGVALNFEARGNDGPVIMFETSEGNDWMVDGLAAAPDPVGNSLSYEIYRRMPNDTDLSVLKRAGLPGMNFAQIGGLTHYHTATDDLKSVSEPSLQHHGSYALSLARGFGGLSLDGHGRANAVYFNLFGPVFVHYSGALVLPLAALTVLLYVGMLVLGFRQRRLTAKGIVFGALALVLSAVVAALAVTLVWRLALPLHRGFESTPWGDPFDGGFYVVAMVLLTLAVVAALYNWFRRRASVANLAAGSFLCWVVLAFIVSLLVPGASYLLVWPLLCALVGMVALFLMWEQESASRWVVLALMALPAVALFSPLVQQVFTALTLNAAGLVAILLVLLCGLLVPHLQILAGSKPWVFPVVAASLGVALIEGGLAAAASAGGRHERDNVFYGLNADTGEAIWASDDAAPDEWTAQFFPSGGQPRDMANVFPVVDKSMFLTAAAAPATLPAPEVSLLEETRDGETRALRLRVTSPRKAPLVCIYAAADGGLLAASVNGVEVPLKTKGRNFWGVNYYAFPEEGVELTLRVKASSQVRMRLNDLSYGLPAELPVRPRPARIVPSPVEFSDATVVSKTFKL